MGGKFTRRGFGYRSEINEYGVAGFSFRDGLKVSIARVHGVSLDVALGRERVVTRDRYGHVDVRGPLKASGSVGNRFDGSEAVVAGGPGFESAEALKVPIQPFLPGASRMDVDTIVVHLPNLDDRLVDGIAFWVEHPSAEVRDFSDGGRRSVADDDEVVVAVQGKVVGVEGSFGLARGQRKGLRERAWGREEGSAQSDTFEKYPSLNRK